ncbi:unnamed protein product [Ceratitis capitata]|uniref:(Mediterranean fruit fly) hypothetical protein n=1 Tax=Ceratitis capitata TaxID=7213 RepID=A0A811UKL5_CERCA|nr:unnamed protein product [Ceratitis capitata]
MVKSTQSCQLTMLSSSFDFDSIRKKGLDLTAKCFPNNYSNLSDRLDFAPNNSQRLAEQTSDLYPKCSCTTEAELRLASMRIFATIMLNAWRRRREDVKRLLVKVEELKKGTQKAKNKIHVYNTLFRVEQKRNDELSCQLKCSIESVMHAKSSCENLSTSVISLEAERLLLEQDLTNKSKELEALTDILSQTKEQLLQSMIDQHNLRFTLNKEQRLVQELENQKNKLINEVFMKLVLFGELMDSKICHHLQQTAFI